MELDDKYKIGIEEIDKQHVKIIKLLQELTKVFDANIYVKTETVRAVFDEVRNYSKYHLKYEEERMLKENFSNFENHKKQHDEFRSKINELSKNDNHPHKAKEVAAFLREWFLNHILEDDKVFGDEVKMKQENLKNKEISENQESKKQESVEENKKD